MYICNTHIQNQPEVYMYVFQGQYWVSYLKIARHSKCLLSQWIEDGEPIIFEHGSSRWFSQGI